MQTRKVSNGAKPASFWSSKLGAASFASIAAMSAMVILSTQMNADPMTGTAGATSLIQIQADAPVMVEIA